MKSNTESLKKEIVMLKKEIRSLRTIVKYLCNATVVHFHHRDSRPVGKHVKALEAHAIKKDIIKSIWKLMHT